MEALHEERCEKYLREKSHNDTEEACMRSPKTQRKMEGIQNDCPESNKKICAAYVPEKR